MRKSKQKEDDSLPKSFYKYVHRFYYLTDTTPESALQIYCELLRISKSEAVDELAKVSQKDIASMQQYINYRASFEFNNPIEEKIQYIKELKLQLWKDSTISKN